MSDGQTDGQNYDSQDRASIAASRGKNVPFSATDGRYDAAYFSLLVGLSALKWSVRPRVRAFYLWPPYVIGAMIFLPCGFFLLSIFFFLFFPRLISAATAWMSTILLYIWCGLSANLECRSEMCCTRLAENTGRKKVVKNRHLGTISQRYRVISSQLRHVSTIGKNLISSNISPTCPPQYSELRPICG